MKILAVTDKVVNSIYGPRIRERHGNVSVALSCGDLSYSYLEYIVSMLNVPCFLVHGNHDHPEHLSSGRTLENPGGWTDIDGRSVIFNGMILAGFEGCRRYRPDASYQHTEADMLLKMWLLTPRLLINRVFHGRYLDILITHAPPFGIHNGDDYAHRGFKALLGFMGRFRPRYLLHGHTHLYRGDETADTRYLDTEVVNVYPFRVIEFRC